MPTSPRPPLVIGVDDRKTRSPTEPSCTRSTTPKCRLCRRRARSGQNVVCRWPCQKHPEMVNTGSAKLRASVYGRFRQLTNTVRDPGRKDGIGFRMIPCARRCRDIRATDVSSDDQFRCFGPAPKQFGGYPGALMTRTPRSPSLTQLTAIVRLENEKQVTLPDVILPIPSPTRASWPRPVTTTTSERSREVWAVVFRDGLGRNRYQQSEDSPARCHATLGNLISSLSESLRRALRQEKGLEGLEDQVAIRLARQ